MPCALLPDPTDCQWSASNAILLTASLDGTVRAWSVDRGALVRTLALPGPPLAVQFHPTNNNVIVV